MASSRTSRTRVVGVLLVLAALLPMARVVDASTAGAGPAAGVSLEVTPQPAAVDQIVTYVGKVANSGDQHAQAAYTIWKLREFTPDAPTGGVAYFNPNVCHVDGQDFDALGTYYRISCWLGPLGVGQQATSELRVEYNSTGNRRVELVGILTAEGYPDSRAQVSHELVVNPKAPPPPPSPLDAILQALAALLGG